MFEILYTRAPVNKKIENRCGGLVVERPPRKREIAGSMSGHT